MTGVLTIEVSLDKGQTYSKLENNAHTTLSVTSLVVIDDNTDIIISPKLIDKFSLTHPIKINVHSGASSSFRPEPSYLCRITAI